MEISWDITAINLTNLQEVSRGDRAKMKKYLVQFKDLIPPRIEILKAHIETGDRKKIRQTLHQMSPQLQFFGVPDVVEQIHRLAYEYKVMDWEELVAMVSQILIKLNNASKEVNRVLNQYFSK